jgi:hypothetical protein
MMEDNVSSKTLRSFVRSSTALAGAVFIFLPDKDSPEFNGDLAHVLSAALANNARFIGMTSGLLQVIVDNVDEKNVEGKTRFLSEELITCTQHRSVVVWTVQQCALGCWGDEASITYGALVPNFQQIMTSLGSGKPGQNIRV